MTKINELDLGVRQFSPKIENLIKQLRTDDLGEKLQRRQVDTFFSFGLDEAYIIHILELKVKLDLKI